MFRRFLSVTLSFVVAFVLIGSLFYIVIAQDSVQFSAKINWAATNEKVELSFVSYEEQNVFLKFHYSNSEIITDTISVSTQEVSYEKIRRESDKTLSIVDIHLPNGELIYTTWDSTICSEGPLLEIKNLGEQTSRSIVNTTGQTIFFIDHSVINASWQPLQPGETYEFTDIGSSGFIEIRIDPGEFENCASITWDFLPKDPEFPGYPIEIRNTQMFQGHVYFIDIYMKNLTGFRGMSGVIQVDEKLQLLGQVFEHTLSEGMTQGNHQTVSNSNVLTFALATRDPMSSTEGTMFRLMVQAIGDYPNTATITMTNLQISPPRPFKVIGGEMIFGTQVVSGTIVDGRGNRLPDTNLVITSEVRSAVSAARLDGSFQLFLQEVTDYELSFSPSRFTLIPFNTIQYSLNCIVGMFTCETQSMDSYDNERQDIEDTICFIDFWLTRPRDDCVANEVQYYFSPKTFNNFTPGLHNMHVVGILVGDIIVLRNNKGEVGATSTIIPKVTLTKKNDTQDGAVIIVNVSATDPLESVGLSFSHNLSGASTENWYQDKLLLQSNETNEIVAEITVPVTQTMRFNISRIYYGEDLYTSDAFIDLQPYIVPQISSAYLPFVGRKE